MAIKWEEIEKWLRNSSRQMNWEGLKDSKWVEQFLSNFVPEQEANKNTVRAQKYEIKEGKEVLEIVFPLPQSYEKDDLLLYVREDCVRIEGLPNEQAQLIKLPRLVKARVCKAQIKDDKLNIRLLKRPKSTKFYTHTITF